MSSKINFGLFTYIILKHLLTFALSQYLYCGDRGYYHDYATGTNYGCSCLNYGNFTVNSPFKEDFDTLLSSLSTNVDAYGFYSGSKGKYPDKENAMVLCRADIQHDVCRSCIQNATILAQLCPNQMKANFWGPLCMLRYSNESIFGNMATYPHRYTLNQEKNVTNPYEFTRDLRTLLGDLQSQAAYSSPHKVAVGNRSTADLQTIYALVQCTPDISSEDCTTCLVTATKEAVNSQSTLVRIYYPSCILFYSIDPFFNGTRIRELELVTTPTRQIILSPTLSSGNGDQNTHQTIIIILSVVVGGLLLVILAGVLLRKKINHQIEELPIRQMEKDGTKISIVESLQYDFRKIRIATNGFFEDNKLGQGGFGAVYRGILPNGQHIAVKRLSGSSNQGDVEFKNEVVLLARLQHKNLVKLLGFSIEETEKLLVYEFLENSSLDHFIFDPAKRADLDWDTRYRIICGIAKGLLYLHQDSRLKIIHRDLKPGNVLLDKDMNPKIADFGMARLFVLDETQANTNKIVGTYGYMAPEYATYGEFSAKSDVYSFGVLVLEIISGQKNMYFHNGRRHSDRLISSAWKNWQNGTTVNLIDSILKNCPHITTEVLRCIHIGLLCIQENAVERPSMASIVIMLSTNIITLPIPSVPAYIEYDSEDSDSTDQTSTTKSSNPSQKDVSVTEFYSR